MEDEYRMGKRVREFVSGSEGVIESAQLGTNQTELDRQRDK